MVFSEHHHRHGVEIVFASVSTSLGYMEILIHRMTAISHPIIVDNILPGTISHLNVLYNIKSYKYY